MGVDAVPPYEVACLEFDSALEAAGHRHVTFIETSDPDGGRTRWSCVQVIAAIRDGERFVVIESGRDHVTLLEPVVCPICPFATLLTDPVDELPRHCE